MGYIYEHDWFTRDTNYTSSNKELKLGWEGIIGSQYSKYLYTNSIAQALLADDYELKDELTHINQMLELDNNVLIDNEGTDCYTDGKTIVISKEYACKAESDFDKMDVLIGLLLHESAHCLYTDFGYIRANKGAIKPLVHTIHNIIEDELIERKLGHNYPGYINFISKVKYYYFGILGNRITDNVPVNELDQIIQILLYVIRYPKHIPDLEKTLLLKYEDLFTQIKSILNTCECLDIDIKQSPTIRSVNAAIKIVELLKKYIDDVDEYSEKGVGTGSGENSTFGQQLSECQNNEKSMLNGITAVMGSLGSESENSKHDSKKINRIILENSERKTAKKYIGKGCRIGTSKKRHNNILRYNKLLKTVQPYIKEARKLILPNNVKEVLKVYDYRRNGSLDPRRLADAMQNNSQVFQQRLIEKKKVEMPKYALVLVLDESGSMCQIHDYVTSLAILIYEALSQFPNIELYIYGHGDVVNTYIDKYNKTKYILGDCELQGNQNEAKSYKIIIDKVRKQTKLPIVCISFTDSCYCTDVNLLQEILDDYRRHNCSFNLVCIGDEDLHKIVDVNNNLYGEGNWFVHKDMTNNGIKEMIKELSLIIKKNYEKYNK
jgi:hypothetical protein